MTGAPVLLMALAAAGSGAASMRTAQPPLLRLAHAVMAVVMLMMVFPAGPYAEHVISVLSVTGLALVAAIVFRHYAVHANGLPCAVDLAGMCLLLAVLALTNAPRAVVLLLALGWAVSSFWAHGEWALKTRMSSAIALEAGAAAIGALAMALMAT